MDKQALARIRDLVMADPIAPSKWFQVIDNLEQFPEDFLPKRRFMLQDELAEAVLKSLEIWQLYGGERWQLVEALRDCGLTELAERVDRLQHQNQADISNTNTPIPFPGHEPRVHFTDDPPAKMTIVGEESSSSRRRSEVNQSFIIREDEWVVSLARKPDSIRQQHAFLIIEGIRRDFAKIWFIDFVSNGGWQFGTHAGKVRIYAYQKPMNEYPKDAKDGLLFSRRGEPNEKMMNPKPKDQLIAISWQVGAQKLWSLIEKVHRAKDGKAFPKFVITGRGSVFAQSSDVSSPDTEGPRHNCFTWARAQLATLNEDVINDILEYKDEWSWVANFTSRVLVDDRPSASRRFHELVIILLIIFILNAVYFYASANK